LDIEAMIHRLAEEIHRARPGRRIGVALDEWNLWLAPPEGAATMHRVVYTLRDALYAAGVLNAFHRCAGEIAIANLAQLVNVLPAIVTEDRAAYPTPIYFPFLLYREMESIALRPKVDGPTFNSLGLGERSDALEGQNINAHAAVPYLDVTATCDPERRRVVIGLVNRHPFRPAQVRLSTRGLEGLRPSSARALTGPGPLAANDLGRPSRVHVGEAELPRARGGRLAARLPASSVTVWVLE
jgi:alpha-N-arabinofuranosidase